VTTVTIIIIAILVLCTILLMTLLGSLYRKVGPNRALIVYGSGGTKVLVGGGTVVKPLFQRAVELNIELMSFDVAPNFDLYTNQGIPVKIEAITQLKVENEEEKILRSANQFLSKSDDEREMMVRQVMEGHLRGIVGQLTVEQLVKDPELVSARMRETVASDLDKLGLEVVSFTLKDVSDDSGYITNMSRPEIARNKQLAEIAEAEAMRSVAVRQSETQREAAQARAKADQERVLAESISKTAQAEAQRDLEVKEAEYLGAVSQQKAQADRAYDIQSSITQQRLVEEQAKVELVRKQQEIKVQQAEAERKAAELRATVQRQAEAENERIRILAEADQRRTVIGAEGQARSNELQAEGDAAATRARANADAEAIKARGFAEAEALQAKGLAEAEALHRRIDVLNRQNQSAILDKALSALPEIAGKMSEAYSKIGSVTYVSSGEGDGVTSRIGRDIVGMVPMMSAVFESATGLKLREMIGGIKPNGNDAHEPVEADVTLNGPELGPDATPPITATPNGDAALQKTDSAGPAKSDSTAREKNATPNV
jgi:flotillin